MQQACDWQGIGAETAGCAVVGIAHAPNKMRTGQSVHCRGHLPRLSPASTGDALGTSKGSKSPHAGSSFSTQPFNGA